MEHYNPIEIEKKWQKIWDKNQEFKATEPRKKDGSIDFEQKDKNGQPVQKMYLAEMFPYPSGAGLHVGHVRNFSIIDVLSRFYAQQGMNVLRPFGYDTFGLPAENYAIKTGISPEEATATNIANFRKQAKSLGFAIDWSREISTSDPNYYKWTQWCFLKLFEKGLAYQKESYQWWCPVDQTVLANEQVENGKCWRCGEEVEKKKMKQWFFKITDYADELLDSLDDLDWPEKIKTAQKNWIGRSKGAEVEFAVKSSKDIIKVFTTRPDTLFGATFLVLAPEHPMVKKLTTDDTKNVVENYCKESIKKSEIERQENKDKTGVFTGSYAINPATGKEIPIWVSDYVLAGYGEGAIMAVPAHDERDNAFAEKFDLPIIEVIEKPDNVNDKCYSGEGKMVNSDRFNGVDSSDAREQIVEWLTQQKQGKERVTYHMRDWLISRQRYWGCPIPIAYDKNGKPHAIPEDQLPVMHPKVDDYKPDSTGRSALAKAKEWLNITLEIKKSELDADLIPDQYKDASDATLIPVECERETDTLDGYACSSWYLWRYVSPNDNEHAWNDEAIKYWEPLDVYCGGDHAVAHLLYVRFWCKFFADQGYLPFREPIKKLLYNGYINAPDGKKMSKSKGNVIDPLDVIDAGYGADTLRTYELFIGPYNEDAAWSTKAIGGVYRFLNRCFNLVFVEKDADSKNDVIRNKTIKKVTFDLRNAGFNTAVAALMEYINELYKSGASKEDKIILAKLLKPFAPHLASEMLEKLDSDDVWPVADESALTEDVIEMVVQVNGKLRARISVDAEDIDNNDKITEMALANENVKKFVSGEPKKVIIPGNHKIINIVV